MKDFCDTCKTFRDTCAVLEYEREEIIAIPLYSTNPSKYKDQRHKSQHFTLQCHPMAILLPTNTPYNIRSYFSQWVLDVTRGS